jgi:hypothetical protein
VLAFVNNGDTSQDVEIYGNIIDYDGNGEAAARFIDADPSIVSNWKIFNNTIVGWSSACPCVVLNGGTATSRNNILANQIHTYGPGWDGTNSHNAVYNIVRQGTGDVTPSWATTMGSSVQIFSSDPFVNYAARDLRLNAPSLPGSSASSPAGNANDMFGHTRGADGVWDRGALEFGAVAPLNPTVTITTPTSASTSFASSTPLKTLAGVAAYAGSVASCTGSSAQTGSFTVTGTTSWTAADIPLLVGDNVLTVACRNTAGDAGSDVLTVTYTPPPASPIDGFNRVDAPTLGPNWVHQTSATISIASSGARATSAAPHLAFWSAHVVPTDQYAQVTVRTISANLQYAYVTCRATDTTNATYDQYQLNTDGATGSGHTQLNKVVNGVLSVLTFYTATFTNGDVLRIECTGSNPARIKAFKNGIQLGVDYVDSLSPLAGGQPGIGLFGANAGADDWEGGGLGLTPQAPGAPTNLRIVR